jgi:glycosyltransferase involved in cell wall biosynthesis
LRNSSIAAEPLRRGADLLARLASFATRPGWLTSVTPTADIYFLNAMRDLVSAEGGVTAVGPNVYGAGGRFVILRYASDAELALLEQARPRLVFYLIDDDLEALSRCSELPAGYRARLAAFVARSLPRILAMADIVLAPNALLLSRFPDHDTGLVAPSYCSLCGSFAHFAENSPLRLVFTGSRSHAGDLEVIAPALERLCQSHPHIKLTTFLGSASPGRLRRLGNVVSRPALPWASYRRFMATARFHIALAPFRRTATNECRSHNKVHDHAAFGAAGLYGDILPYRETVTHGQEGLLLSPEPEAWFEAIARLVQDPASARELAEAAVGLSERIGNPGLLRTFWCRRLELDGS